MLFMHKEPKCNPLTLAFTDEDLRLESQFLDEYFNDSLKFVRFSSIIACVLYGIYGFLDALLEPESTYVIWGIRFGIAVPAIFSIFLLSFSSYFKRCWQFALFIAGLAAGLGVVAMMVITKEPVNYLIYAGLMLVIMYCYTFFKMRFIWATAVSWTIIICYEITAIWISETPIIIFINNNFFLFGANLIGMFASYSAEYQARRNYYLFMLLQNEKATVKTINEELITTIRELNDASEKIKILQGCLPICCSCKKIKDDQGFWKHIESYIQDHSEANFSHGICPECTKRLYPDIIIPDK